MCGSNITRPKHLEPSVVKLFRCLGFVMVYLHKPSLKPYSRAGSAVCLAFISCLISVLFVTETLDFAAGEWRQH